ncbi:CRAL-TRIO domain-containing protein [Citrus sinensis]|uniref:CRAL-TRIO domain-containing protein n=1 Tax=Citrus sinensis TaxID=2711 RepID=A0ACB8HYG5_CITSI|nr:CRAL-TRIO domain-containing protein [Citrus sinensis]
MGSSCPPSDDLSVMVLASDLGIDARPFLSKQQDTEIEEQEQEQWHDCAQYLSPDEDFSDLDSLQFFCLQGSDKSGNRIFRLVGKYFPGNQTPSSSRFTPRIYQLKLLYCWSKYASNAAPPLSLSPVVGGERLKKYIFHKICSELPDGPFCIVYMHTCVQKEDNYPGFTILRWIYEELPSRIKNRLQIMYFIHPGLWSRLAFATVGRFFLSGGLYWKIKYVSRLQYLWNDIKKGEIEIPEFVQNHDNVLEHRPLTDYGIEPDHLHLPEVPNMAYSFGRHDGNWGSREFMR